MNHFFGGALLGNNEDDDIGGANLCSCATRVIDLKIMNELMNNWLIDWKYIYIYICVCTLILHCAGITAGATHRSGSKMILYGLAFGAAASLGDAMLQYQGIQTINW